jgi:hypothetical protein
MKPGENEPNVYIFETTTSEKDKATNKDVTVVKATKFHVDYTFQVPNVRGADGKMEPKEEITKVANDLKQGDMVEVQTAGQHTLKSIKVYEPPKWAEFVKLSKQTVADQELHVLEVKAYGTSTTLTIARKDAALLTKLAPLKEGSLLTYKSNTDDKGGLWLTDVRIPPKGATMPAEPTSKEADDSKSSDKKSTDKKSDSDKKGGDADKKKAGDAK